MGNESGIIILNPTYNFNGDYMFLVVCKKKCEETVYYIYAEPNDSKAWTLSKKETYIRSYSDCLEIINEIKSQPKCSLESIEIVKV